MSNSNKRTLLNKSVHNINQWILSLNEGIHNFFKQPLKTITIQYLTDTPLTTEEGNFSEINHFNQQLKCLYQKAHSLINLDKHETIQQLETTYDEINNSSAVFYSKALRKRMPECPSGSYPNLSTGR